MALDIGTLAGYLDLDTKPYDDALGGAEGGLGKLGTVAAGVAGAMGAALAKGLADGMDMEVANDKLAAQMGATGQFAADLGKVAGDLYSNAYGDSLGEVNEAIRGVMQNGVLMEDASNEQIEAITGKVMDLASAFDQDLNMSTQAVGTMLRTGLAKDADEALDVLTRGMQQGANKADDLLETFQEYSTMFRDIGISAADATGLLTQGLQAGARDADTVADALKEFAIRGQDASETSAAGFEAIGLSASEMTAKVAAGGPEARDALDQVLDGLRGMEDPVARNAAAVALFGTKAEDLGDALFALDPSEAVRSLGDVAGAATEMGNTLNDNAATKIETFKRTALMALTDFVGNNVVPQLERLGNVARERVGPVIEAITGYFKENKEALAAAAAVIAGLLVAAFYAWASAAVSAAAATIAATWPILAIGAAIAALAFGLVYAYRHFEGFRDVVDGVVSWVKANAIPLLRRLWSSIVEGAQAMWAFIQPVIAAVVEFLSAKFSEIVAWAQETWPQLQEAVTHVFNVIVDVVTFAVGLVMTLWDMFGEHIINAATTVWGLIQVVISSALGLVMGLISTVLAIINGDWGKAWDGMKNMLAAVWDLIFGIVTGALSLIWTVVQAGLDLVVGVFSWAWSAIVSGASSAAGSVISWITGVPGRLIGLAADFLSAGAELGGSILDGIKGGLTSVWGWAQDVAGSVVEAFKSAWNTLAGEINDFLPNEIGGWGPLPSVDLPDSPIPTFHTGGVVPGGAGSEVLALLQGGERVLARNDPLTKMLDAGIDPLTAGRPSAAARGGVPSVRIEHLHLATTEPARSWLDESSWRLAG